MQVMYKVVLVLYLNEHSPQEPAASANLDVRAIKNEHIGVVAEGLAVHYVVSVKSVKFLPTT
jgi:hypothetical protein